MQEHFYYVHTYGVHKLYSDLPAKQYDGMIARNLLRMECVANKVGYIFREHSL